MVGRILGVIQLVGVVVGTIFALHLLFGLVGTSRYGTEKADERAEDVRLVLTTIASENVRPALLETIDHTVTKFQQYDVFCVVDEGSDLQEELSAREDVETVVVPDSFECTAIAKGRAIEYFIRTVVAEDPDYWYGFIDDDNLILDDSFLYEIPVYESKGYGAMNPVLKPRLGDSVFTFLADQIRYTDDITIYRLFTGVVGRPYLGFHGELLCARGDVLLEIGFDRESIVEDFAFAMQLIEERVPVWQSETEVSILSPHDFRSFLKQRTRWFVGIASYLPRSPLVTQLSVGSRVVIWSVGLTSNWLVFPVWIYHTQYSLPLIVPILIAVGSALYIVTVGFGAARIGGLKGAVLFLLVPVYALMEHCVPIYAMFNRERQFTVIDK